MIPIKNNKHILFIAILVLYSFMSCDSNNSYYFSDNKKGWNVIINGVDSSLVQTTNNKHHKFKFDSNGFVFINNNFSFSKEDKFYFNGNIFDPDNKNEDSIKLCYFGIFGENDINIANIYSKSWGIPLNSNFQIIYFRIGVDCNEDKDLDVFEYIDTYFKNASYHVPN